MSPIAAGKLNLTLLIWTARGAKKIRNEALSLLTEFANGRT